MSSNQTTSNPSIDEAWSGLRNATIALTGATGLIGSRFVKKIQELNNEKSLGCKLILFVRNPEKAEGRFGDDPSIETIQWSMGEELPQSSSAIDYFVHMASPTSSKRFIQTPVEVITSTVDTVNEVLRYAKEQSVRKVLLLSTMEVYGQTQGKVNEEQFGSLDPMQVRNCYPESKRLAECLFASYAHEYNTPACVLRLAQSFGAGVPYEDGRVFADFARCIVESRDIVLFSDGKNKNPYLSINDAVNAIVVCLAFGKPGEAYNAANEETYCTIREMAELVLSSFATAGSQVVFGTDEERASTFRKASDLQLDTTKLQALGWKSNEGLLDMYNELLLSWRTK